MKRLAINMADVAWLSFTFYSLKKHCLFIFNTFKRESFSDHNLDITLKCIRSYLSLITYLAYADQVAVLDVVEDGHGGVLLPLLGLQNGMAHVPGLRVASNQTGSINFTRLNGSHREGSGTSDKHK
jgi:hypothetical protein